MNERPDLFPGFRADRRPGRGVDLFCRIGGDGPPLVLLHGYPQSHVMWHRISSELARHFTCVIPDLRGYGDSDAPRGDGGRHLYSKRAMAADIVALMTGLGHQRFAVVGHDRGARVGYRLALDHADRVSRLAVIDILPTYDYWRKLDRAFGLKIYHWMFLAQPEPLPETLIERAPVTYLEHTLASWTKAGDLSVFGEGALAHYRHFFTQPERIHATCEDYRAGAFVDFETDAADVAAGRKIACPVQVLWGAAGIAAEGSGPLETWMIWADDLRGQAIDSGHFIAEENPKETLAALLPFLRGDT